MKNETKNNIVIASLAITLFFMFPNAAYAAVPGLTLGSNMKADKVTVDVFTGAFTLNGYSLDIDGSQGLVVTSGTVDASTSTINIAGTLNVNPSVTFYTATIILDAQSGSPQIISGNINFGNLTIAASGATYTVTTNNLYVANTLTISGGTLNMAALDLWTGDPLTISGGTLDCSNVNCDLDIGGSVTVSSGTLIAPPVTDNSSFLVGGNWAVTGSGTFTPSNGRVVLITNAANITTTSSNANAFYQLYINGNTKYLQDDLTVLNSFNILSGTLDTDSNGDTAGGTVSNLEVGGDWDNIGTFTQRTSTVIFNGTANQTITTSNKTFYSVTLNNTGASGSDRVTISGNLDIDGNLTLTNGDLRLSTGTPNVTLAGNLVIDNTADPAVTRGSGTWTFDGATAATITDSTVGLDLGAIILNKTDTVSPSTNDKVTLASSVKITSVTVDGTAGSPDTLALGSSGYVLTLTGNGTPLTVSGTLTEGTNSLVKFAPAGTTGVTVPGRTYNNIEFNKASNTFTLGGALVVSSNLTITSGTLSTGGANINLAGNWTNSGIFTHGSASVILDGTNQIITGSTTFNHLTKTVTSAATLTLEDTGTYQVAGLLTLKGASGQLLTVTSDDAVQTADLIVNTGTGTIDLDYLTPVRIDSSTGLLMIATNSTAPSGCVNWQGGTSGVNFTWDGSAGTSTWTTAANWDRGMVPASNSNVTIPSASFDPALGANRTLNNVTIQVGGVLVLGGSNLTLAGNTFANSGTLRLQGGEIIDFGSGGAAMDNDSGLFEYVGGGSGTYTVADWGSTDYWDLKINKAAENFLLGSALTVANDLTISAGTLDTDSNGDSAGGTIYSVNIKGNANLTGTFKARSGTLTLFNDGVDEIKTLTTGGNTLNNVVINHTASTTKTARVSGALDINGTFTLSSGALDLATNNVAVNVAGDVSVANGASVTKATSSAWTFDGTTQSYTDSNATKQNLGAVVI